MNETDDLGPPKERGSVRAVTLEGDRRTYHCEVRVSPGSGLQPGAFVWIEFGAVWAEEQGVTTKVRGQWRQCFVLPGNAGTSAEVHVRLSPKPGAELIPPVRCYCNQGFVCEDHTDKPRGHDGCDGAGIQCANHDCPWW